MTDGDSHEAARIAVLNTIASLLEALKQPEATRELAQLPPQGMLPGGARVVGTSYELPVEVATKLMAGLAALAGNAPQALLTALARGDADARLAVLKGQPPPTVSMLYAHCAGIEAPSQFADYRSALARIADVVETMFSPGQVRRLFELVDEWFEQPAALDAVPLQRFVAQFIRNAPP
jgi:hypothetical protein